MAQKDSSIVAGKSVKNSLMTGSDVTSETPKSPWTRPAHIAQELPPDRLVEPVLVEEHGVAFGRNAALAGPHLDRIAGNQADRDEEQRRQAPGRSG